MRYIITTVILVMLACVVQAAGNDTITKLESNLFGIDYSDQPEVQRLARLEQSVYGKSFNDSTIKRVERLYADMSADVIGKEITPKADTFAEEELQELQEKVNYPVLDEMENSLFKRTYGEKDLNSRLAFLEKYVFSNVYDKENYSERVDRLREKVLGTRMDEIRYQDDENGVYGDDLGLANSFDSPFDNSFGNSYGNSSGNYYGNSQGEFGYDPDTSYSALDRLRQDEQHYFNKNYDNESVFERKKRLSGVKKAKKYSGKYDNNRFQQKFTSAMQIGTMLLMILAMVL